MKDVKDSADSCSPYTSEEEAKSEDITDTEGESEGEMFLYPVIHEFRNDEEIDIFDDGVSNDGDDDSSTSDISTTYEELEEPTIVTRIKLVQKSDNDDTDTSLEQDHSSDEDYASGSSDSDVETYLVDDIRDNNDSKTPTPDTGTRKTMAADPVPITFAEINALVVQAKSKESRSDAIRWKIFAAEEAKIAIELELEQLMAEL